MGKPKYNQLTNEIIDSRLKDRSVKRISAYINIGTKIDWKCLDCGKIFTATPRNVVHHNSGCNRCAKNEIIDNDTIDFRLVGRNIERLGSYVRTNISILWKCRVCDHEWYSTPNNVLSGMCGCTDCVKLTRLTKESIDLRLYKKGLIITSQHINYIPKDIIEVKCLVCGTSRKSKLNALLNSKTRCLKCSNMERTTNERIDKFLTDNNRNILRLEESHGSHIKIKFKCLCCNNEWDSTPSNIISGKGCPDCRLKNETRIRIWLKEKYGKENVTKLTLRFNNRKYFIDFVVNGILIEYNGEQHYKPVEYWGGEESFDKQQKRDKELRDYCLANNIRLIEIPYYLSHEQQYKLIEGLYAII